MLTRPQFDAACKALIKRYAGSASGSVETNTLRGWSWHEHFNYPNLGYMSRTVNLFCRPESCAYNTDDLLSDDVSEEPDPSALPVAQESDTYICQQYVVFSSTFRVPTFYFLVCSSSGAPLPLSDVLRTSLFKMNTCDNDNVEISSYSISLPTSAFPLLSHGDHPTLGTPCWYFHPCATTAAVEELILEVEQDGWDEDTKLVRWLELWFMVVCSAVNL